VSVKGFVSRASLVVLSTLFALFLCEILLRVFWPPVQPVGFQGVTVHDSEFGHRLVPNSSKVISSGRGEFSTKIEINSHGFRFPEYETKPEPGVFRIALFGDSEVFGVGVAEEDMLNMRMEELLNASGDTEYQVLNFAMPAIGTIVEARILEQVALAWEPDAAVFIVTVANDLTDNVNFVSRGHAPEQPPKEPNVILSWFKGLRLYAFAGFKVYPNLPGFLTPPAAWFNIVAPTVRAWYVNENLDGDFAVMTDALARSKAICDENGVEMYLAAIPARVQFVPDVIRLLRKMTEPSVLRAVESDPDRPQRMLREFAAERGIPYIEVLTEFQELAEHGAQLRYKRDGHLNTEGTYELARILANGIRDKHTTDAAIPNSGVSH
jgi:hypothetical protein